MTQRTNHNKAPKLCARERVANNNNTYAYKLHYVFELNTEVVSITMISNIKYLDT